LSGPAPPGVLAPEEFATDISPQRHIPGGPLQHRPLLEGQAERERSGNVLGLRINRARATVAIPRKLADRAPHGEGSRSRQEGAFCLRYSFHSSRVSNSGFEVCPSRPTIPVPVHPDPRTGSTNYLIAVNDLLKCRIRNILGRSCLRQQGERASC